MAPHSDPKDKAEYLFDDDANGTDGVEAVPPAEPAVEEEEEEEEELSAEDLAGKTTQKVTHTQS